MYGLQLGLSMSGRRGLYRNHRGGHWLSAPRGLRVVVLRVSNPESKGESQMREPRLEGPGALSRVTPRVSAPRTAGPPTTCPVAQCCFVTTLMGCRRNVTLA